MVDILDSYFDPEKEAIVPPTKQSNPRRRSFKGTKNVKGSPRENRRSRNGNNDKTDKKHPTETNNNEIASSPDTPRRQRRSRRRYSRNDRNKSTEMSATDIGTTVISPMIKTTAQSEIAVA